MDGNEVHSHYVECDHLGVRPHRFQCAATIQIETLPRIRCEPDPLAS